MPGRDRLKSTIANALNAIDDAQSAIGGQLDRDKIEPDAAKVVDRIKEHAEAMRKPLEAIIKEGG